MIRALFASLLLLAAGVAPGADRAAIGPGKFDSVLPPAPDVTSVAVR